LIFQIGIVIILGFILSLWLFFYLLSSERAESLNYLSSTSAVQRVISVSEALDKTPEALHENIIRISTTPDLSLSISVRPNVVTTSNSSSEEKQLLSLFRSANLNQAHVSLVTSQRAILDMEDMHNSMMRNGMMRNSMMRNDMMKQMSMRRFGYIATIDGSVRLPSGEWLNFSSGVREEATEWSFALLFSLFAVATIVVLLSLWIIKQALKPIAALADAAKKFGIEKELVPLDEKGASDLLPTIAAFNEMQRKLTSYINDRTKLLAAISHDLKTPLTSLRLRLEFIEESEDKQQMLNTLQLMEKMLNATMSFAKQQNELEARQLTNINTLFQTIVDEYAEKGVSVIYESSHEDPISCPPVSIRRMVENLVNNSIQYAGGYESVICIDVELSGEMMIISVTDEGPGIEEDKFEEVIKPFVRLDSARDTTSSNVGLGLSITQSIAQSYGGKLSLQQNTPTGLRAIIELPVLSGD
jgi:signal transduction histidine kinase